MFKRKIWIYDRGDYELLKQKITDVNWNTVKNEYVNIYAENVNKTSYANKPFPQNIYHC